MNDPRSGHTATLLPSGHVLVAGGISSAPNGPAQATSELYDPATDLWSLASSMAVPRQGHGAVLLDSGQVLVIGGAVDGNAQVAPA